MKREFCWLHLLSVLVVAVLFLAMPETSRAQSPTCGDAQEGLQVFLNLKGTAPNLELSLNGELGLTPTSIDSPPLRKAGGNPYKEIGTWSTGPLTSFSNAHPECWGPGIQNLIFRPHVWLGDSGNQGTKFDLLAQVLLDGVEIGEAEVHCVEGVKRNPAEAVEVAIPPAAFGSFRVIAEGPVLPTDSELMLRISARIGTEADGPCKGHSSSKGLRLYYGSTTRPSHILWRLCGPFDCLPPIRD